MRVEDLAWLSGRWMGCVGDEDVEEVWSLPMGGTMMGMFRWLRGGAPRFYEMIVLEPEQDGVRMRIRHFSPGPGLPSWEQDGAMEFDLTEHRERRAVFADRRGKGLWLKYELDLAGQLTVCFETATGEPPVKEPFIFVQSSF
jgi:hypothetical protein